MNRRPHVILEALQVRARSAGTGRAIGDLTRALADRDRGLDFTVLAAEPGVFQGLEGNPHWRVVTCDGAQGGNLRKAWFTQARLPGLVKELGGDLLHCLQFIAPLRCPCPLVATVYDLAWLRYPETIDRPRRWYYEWVVPRSLARADAVTAISEATADETARFFPETKNKIRVTPLGTPSWVRGKAGAVAPVQADKPFFLFVGTLEPRKNLAGLLEAYAMFRSDALEAQIPPARIPRLVLVGAKGWNDASLRSRLAYHREQGWLEVREQCDDADLWDLYRSAVALVFPSLHEGFGLPILEAMAAGLPVLTSDRGGMKEVAGPDALLVNPARIQDIAEGLRVMAFDPSKRQALADAGPGRAAQWSWDRTADLTARVYRELLGNSP